MITFGKNKFIDGYIERTPVFSDGEYAGDIVTTPIGSQYDAAEGFVRNDTVYKTVDICKNALIF